MPVMLHKGFPLNITLLVTAFSLLIRMLDRSAITLTTTLVSKRATIPRLENPCNRNHPCNRNRHATTASSSAINPQCILHPSSDSINKPISHEHSRVKCQVALRAEPRGTKWHTGSRPCTRREQIVRMTPGRHTGWQAGKQTGIKADGHRRTRMIGGTNAGTHVCTGSGRVRVKGEGEGKGGRGRGMGNKEGEGGNKMKRKKRMATRGQ